MIGLLRTTVSPRSSIMMRSTPWVLGCCGPMLMIIDSSSETSTGCSSATSASARRSTAPFSISRAMASLTSALARPWRPSAVRAGSSVRCGCSVVVMVALVSPRRGALELHGDATRVVVLAQRVAYPVLRHQDAGEVGVAVEGDAEHVEGLALHGVGAGVHREERRDDRVGLGHLHPQAYAGALLVGDQRDHDLEALGLD